MKKLLSCLLGLALVASAAFAGVGYSGKEMKQVAPPPCPEWYADREFNISLWGTYVFTGTNWIDDRYIEADHAWGGGIDLKYFFMRYVGVGIEGWAVDARQAREDIFIDFKDESRRVDGTESRPLLTSERANGCFLARSSTASRKSRLTSLLGVMKSVALVELRMFSSAAYSRSAA